MFTNKFFCSIIYRFVSIIISLSLVILFPGCADLTQPNLTQLDNSIFIQPKCICHEGHVFAIRGFLGIWSRGMYTISARAQNEFHIPSTTIGSIERVRLTRFIIKSYREGQLVPPIILVGHSLGSDDVVAIAWDLYRAHIPVQLLSITDPVIPLKIPPNVIHAYNVYKDHPMTDWIPIYRGVTLKAIDPSKTQVENVNIRGMSFDNDKITHFNIDIIPQVQNMMLARIKQEVDECRSRKYYCPK